MSTALALAPVSANVPTQMGDTSVFDALAKSSGGFLKGLKLYSKGSAIDKGQIAPGHYGVYISKEEILDLGTSIDLVVWCRRPFAIDMNDKKNLIRSYDPASEEFQAIQEKTKEKNSHCQAGIEFLVYERSTSEFYVWFCGSASALRAAGELAGYMPVDELTATSEETEVRGPIPVNCSVRLIEGEFTYHVPVIDKSTTPFTKLPEEKEIVDQITKFCNPKTDKVEAADESEQTSRAR